MQLLLWKASAVFTSGKREADPCAWISPHPALLSCNATCSSDLITMTTVLVIITKDSTYREGGLLILLSGR